MNIRDTFIHQLLVDSGLQAGMRILDVGCGSGDLTYLVDDILEHNVAIVGIDISDTMLNMAEMRKKNTENITFVKNDIISLPENVGKFDFIIGRRILMYLPNVGECLKVLKSHLKNGGKMIFQESDCMAANLNGDAFAFHNKIQSYIWKTVELENGDTHIGSKLYQLFKDNGMKVENLKSELILHTAESGSDIGWVAEVMTDRFRKFGLIDDTWDIEQVKSQLIEELDNSTVPFIRDCAFGICATNK